MAKTRKARGLDFAEYNLRLSKQVSHNTKNKGENGKKTLLLAAITATAIPLVTVFAENAASPTPAEQAKEENSCCMNRMDMSQGKMMRMMGMMSMMSNWKDQDAELDKLVAAMNSAPARQKGRCDRGNCCQVGGAA
jgi:hypothetical protein